MIYGGVRGEIDVIEKFGWGGILMDGWMDGFIGLIKQVVLTLLQPPE